MKPNLFIIGAPKCGTTSLHAYLSTHPQIFMSDIKEPHYFCDDLPRLNRFPTEADYLRLFADARLEHTFRGEATSRNLYSQNAVRNILEFDPNAKIIAMLRNPVDLVHSLHAQLVYQFFENEKDFETAWRLQPARSTGKKIPSGCPEPAELQYGDVASLGHQVARLFEIAPREQVHLVFFDDFKSDVESTYRGVLDFLELPYDDRQQFEQANPHKRYRSGLLAKLLFDPPFPLRQIKSGLKRSFKLNESSLGRWAFATLTVPTQREAMTDAMRYELTKFFENDVRRLEKLTARDLSAWRTVETQVTSRAA